MKKSLLPILFFLLAYGAIFAQYPGRVGNGNNDHDQGYESGYPQRIQMALILDASGSMNGLIDQARAQLWNIVNQLTWENRYVDLEIALYEYGSQSAGARNGYIRQLTPLTRDLDWVGDMLYRIQIGGNLEYAGQAIELATNELNWDRFESTVKLIYIAGNEAFDQGYVDYRHSIRETVFRGITVNTIFCGAYEQGIYQGWRNAAEFGGGTYSNISQNFNRDRDDYYYDSRMLDLNSRLNGTYIPYGAYGSQNSARQIEQDRRAAGYGEVYLAQRAMTKASGAYRNDDWDLVDAVSAGKVDLKAVPEDQLPPEMRSMPMAQREQFVAEKKAERDQINLEMRQLAEVSLEKQKQENAARPASPGQPSQAQPPAQQSLDKAIMESLNKRMKGQEEAGAPAQRNEQLPPRPPQPVQRPAVEQPSPRPAPVIEKPANQPAQREQIRITPQPRPAVETPRPQPAQPRPAVETPRPQPVQSRPAPAAETPRPQPVQARPAQPQRPAVETPANQPKVKPATEQAPAPVQKPKPVLKEDKPAPAGPGMLRPQGGK